MNRFSAIHLFLTACGLLACSYVSGQSKKWTSSISLSHVQSVSKLADPSIWNYPHRIWHHGVINVDEFRWRGFDRNSLSGQHYQYAIGLRLERTLGERDFLVIGTDIIKLRSTGDLSRVIFSDQVHPDHGVSNESQYSDGRITYTYSVINTNIQYAVQQDLRPIKRKQMLALGISSSLIYNSRYYIKSSLSDVGFGVPFDNVRDFKGQDLELSDGVVSMSPMASYRLELFETRNTKVYLNAQYVWRIRLVPWKHRKTYKGNTDFNQSAFLLGLAMKLKDRSGL